MAKTQSENYILTGGPSNGKTTQQNILKTLGMGLIEVTEAPRLIIEREQEKVKRLSSYEGILPWTAPERFEELVVRLQKRLQSRAQEGRRLYDRSLIDVSGFCEALGIQRPENLMQEIIDSGYTAAFILEPLDFFIEDGVRYEGREEGLRVHRLLCEHYRQIGDRIGMPVYSIPNVGPAKRAYMIADRIEPGRFSRADIQETVALLRPEGLEKGLEEDVERVILASSVAVVAKKELALSQEQFSGIYDHLKSKIPNAAQAVKEFYSKAQQKAYWIAGEDAIKRMSRLTDGIIYAPESPELARASVANFF
jgi:predicted ATPase/nucleoside diphosphate kinase